MTLLRRVEPRRFDVECTIEIEQTGESLHAHVSLDGDVDIRPGDQVTIQGAPVRVAFGDCVQLRRTATVVRAGALKRFMTYVAGYLELTELYEVSFSDGRAS
ncbi:hypothetical protein [Nitrobacter sp.]|jgi:hypothetical protein|uniref:hypothetical protein n=1 Tax=Nitrobacter sp. TaxID=29420 RepID=UPI003F6546F9